MLKRLLLLLLALACKARVERVVEVPPARQLPQSKEGDATSTTQLELKMGADGMVRLQRLQLAGDLLIDGAVLRDSARMADYQLAWKSWQGEKNQLLWQQQMDAAQLAQQNGVYLPRAGLGLGKEGLFGVEILLFSQGKIVAQHLLPLMLNPQSYLGGGLGWSAARARGGRGGRGRESRKRSRRGRGRGAASRECGGGSGGAGP